jgi:hypothetical protein
MVVLVQGSPSGALEAAALILPGSTDSLLAQTQRHGRPISHPSCHADRFSAARKGARLMGPPTEGVCCSSIPWQH